MLKNHLVKGWFSLDEARTKEKIKHSPKVLGWVLEVENMKTL